VGPAPVDAGQVLDPLLLRRRRGRRLLVERLGQQRGEGRRAGERRLPVLRDGQAGGAGDGLPAASDDHAAQPALQEPGGEQAPHHVDADESAGGVDARTIVSA
jgi:hypothetical protein